MTSSYSSLTDQATKLSKYKFRLPRSGPHPDLTIARQALRERAQPISGWKQVALKSSIDGGYGERAWQETSAEKIDPLEVNSLHCINDHQKTVYCKSSCADADMAGNF